MFGGRESGRESFNIRGKVGEEVWESPVSGDESKRRSNLNINSFAGRRLVGCWRYVKTKGRGQVKVLEVRCVFCLCFLK